MVKRPAFLLGAALEAVEPEAPVLLVWHPEKVKQASATMSKPQIWQLYLFMPSSDKPLCITFRFIFCFLLLFGLKFKQSCGAKTAQPYPHPHRSPACSPPAPCTPVHLRILVHLSGFEILVRKFICGAELLISLVLIRPTDIGPILSWVRENVVSFPLFVDHGHFAWRKLLELLLLRRRLGGDRLKARGHQHALSVLRAGLCAGAADRQR